MLQELTLMQECMFCKQKVNGSKSYKAIFEPGNLHYYSQCMANNKSPVYTTKADEKCYCIQ